MSYLALARKWRPKQFDDLVGQDQIVKALQHALSSQKIHHAYLLTGTRGVGKTTIARIFSKALNCELGISASPCGVCQTCLEIDAGRFVDMLEIDAATNTRVEEMRSLLENTAFFPSKGRFKVYVVDEVHMLSNAAFNAMLKTLEEPPAHIKFILATTDPQKIPVTVLSRCLQLNLKNVSETALVSHLQKILAAETIDYEESALVSIADTARGSVRDALSLLDQAIAIGMGGVTDAEVTSMLGQMPQQQIDGILNSILANDATTTLDMLEKCKGQNFSFKEVLLKLEKNIFDRLLNCESSARRRLLVLYESIRNLSAQIGWVTDPYANVVAVVLRFFESQEKKKITPVPVLPKTLDEQVTWFEKFGFDALDGLHAKFAHKLEFSQFNDGVLYLNCPGEEKFFLDLNPESLRVMNDVASSKVAGVKKIAISFVEKVGLSKELAEIDRKNLESDSALNSVTNSIFYQELNSDFEVSLLDQPLYLGVNNV